MAYPAAYAGLSPAISGAMPRPQSRPYVSRTHAPCVLAWLAARDREPAAPRPGEPLNALPQARGTPPRRSTCSSSASATRAASTRRTATTSAGWSSTSSHAVTAQSFRGKFSGQLAELRDGDLRLGTPEARALHERVGSLGRTGRALLQGSARAAARRPRRGRPRPRPLAGARRRRARRPQRAPLDRSAARHAGLPPPPHRGGQAGARRPPAACRLRALELRAARRRRGDRVTPPTRSRPSLPRVSSPRRSGSTSRAQGSRHPAQAGRRRLSHSNRPRSRVYPRPARDAPIRGRTLRGRRRT